MNGLLGALARHTTIRSARSVLDTLMASIGSAGLAAAARQPALRAMVDQHAAAVRDRLGGNAAAAATSGELVLADFLAVGRRSFTPVTLAGYAEGVCDAAIEHGWQATTDPVDWSEPDWVLLRLLAVCVLARDLQPQ
ncbi:MAG TPA: DUF6401 family natural product biosynthesis protein [Micromonospora sp.]|nr:DUF6401 family natural product biosynthesis protein [Micromonospora sp.]